MFFTVVYQSLHKYMYGYWLIYYLKKNCHIVVLITNWTDDVYRTCFHGCVSINSEICDWLLTVDNPFSVIWPT